MKVFIKTYGCSASQNDSEILMHYIKESEELVDSEENADTILVNTCAVKDKTEKDEIKYITKLTESGKKVIIAGCLAQSQGNKLKGMFPKSSLLGPHHLEGIKEILNGKSHSDLVNLSQKKSNLQRIRLNPLIHIIQINEGCLDACTYCATKIAKPKLESSRINEILDSAKNAINDGCKEIWLTSQDAGAFGADTKENLAKLLNAMVKLEGDFMIRVGMLNPNNAMPILDELIDSFDNKKIFKFLHLPIQSGSKRILNEMKRGYEAKDFELIINKFRNRFLNMTISTDVICGFPGETNDEFDETIELIKRVRPNNVNISRFSERPNTKAFGRADKLNGNITKVRSTKLSKIARQISLEENQKLIGIEEEILIDEKSNKWIGRNESYRQVLVEGSRNLIGKRLKVKIVNATIHHLIAEKVI